jgi:hypothetical protein
MNTSPASQTLSITETDYKQWLKEQPWNRPGYNASKMKEHAEQGKLMCAAPVGYKNAFAGSEKTVEIDPETAPVVKEAFQLAATGKHSLRRLLAILTPKGLASRNGKRLQASSLWGILTNPFYVGYIRFNGKLIKGRHNSIIDQATFDSVQKVLRKNRRNGRSGTVIGPSS